MAARIVKLVRPQAAPQPAAAANPGVPNGLTGRAQAQQHAWRGASGRLYAHRVFTLFECPPLPAAGYVLVRRDAEGRRTPLRIGVGTSDAPTLNLAEIRQRGAEAGANEVHVSLDAASEADRRLTACDLRAGLFGNLAAVDPERAPRA